MSELKQISEESIPDFVQIVTDAYPAMDLASEEEQQRTIEQLAKIYDDDQRQLIGLYRNKKLLGGMILRDFEMNVHGSRIEMGGVGLVAVHFLHKKEKVAKELMEFFLDHYRERGAALTSLYPFRPDFYGKMGFGYGPKLSEYKILPASFPSGPTKSHVTFVEEDEIESLLSSYNRFAGEFHGMIFRRKVDLERALVRPGYKIAACYLADNIDGYLVYSFEKRETFVDNDLIVHELVYHSPASLSELITFLHSQLDQIRRVVIRTHDDEFHHLLADPRNDTGHFIGHGYQESNVQGVGMMYRVINCEELFKELSDHKFGRQNCVVSFDIADNFLSANSGIVTVSFNEGRATVTPEADPDVDVRLEIAHFSSLVMGTASFRKQFEYGQVQISDTSFVDVMDELFHIKRQPVCMTHF